MPILWNIINMTKMEEACYKVIWYKGWFDSTLTSKGNYAFIKQEKKMSKLNHKEQLRVRVILFEEKLRQLGWKDYCDFVSTTVNDCSKKGEDSDKLFRMLGLNKKRAKGLADISLERCLDLEHNLSYTQAEMDRRLAIK